MQSDDHYIAKLAYPAFMKLVALILPFTFFGFLVRGFTEDNTTEEIMANTSVFGFMICYSIALLIHGLTEYVVTKESFIRKSPVGRATVSRGVPVRATWRPKIYGRYLNLSDGSTSINIPDRVWGFEKFLNQIDNHLEWPNRTNEVNVIVNPGVHIAGVSATIAWLTAGGAILWWIASGDIKMDSFMDSMAYLFLIWMTFYPAFLMARWTLNRLPRSVHCTPDMIEIDYLFTKVQIPAPELQWIRFRDKNHRNYVILETAERNYFIAPRGSLSGQGLYHELKKLYPHAAPALAMNSENG